MLKSNIFALLKAWIRVILFVCPCAFSASWSEYTSENFTVYSDQSSRKIKSLMRDFEAFRLAAIEYTDLEYRPENADMRILVFKKNAEYKKFTGGRNIAGFFRNDWAGPLMVMGSGNRKMTVDSVLYHEYFHYLLRDRRVENYPKWYDEGYAEVLSSASVKGNSVSIGAVPPERIFQLSRRHSLPLPLREILTPRPPKIGETQYWADFYATAWLFTHYIQLGHLLDYPDYSQKIRRYLLAINQGEDPIKAFPKYFQKGIDAVQKELLRYQNEKNLKGFRFTVPAYTGNISRRLLSHNEKIAVIADVARTTGKQDLAVAYLNKIQEKKNFAGENFAMLGLLKNIAEKNSEAIKAISKAEMAGVKTPKGHVDMAQYYYEVLRESHGKGLWDELAYENVIVNTASALAMDNDNMPAYRYRWMSQQLKNERSSAMETMIQAYQYHADDVLLNMEIGVYVALGETPQQAIPFLERVASASQSSEVSKRAETLIASIQQML